MATAPLRGLHHIKFAVSDLDRALKFYEIALNAVRIPEADHRHSTNGQLFAYAVRVPGLDPLFELSLNAEQAKKHALFDSVTITVDDQAALKEWDKTLTDRGILHSPILLAVAAWLIVIQDPDGNRVRLYTKETHGPELKADEESSWIVG